jgi:oligopeptide/dipeptide ABC transporter ATP-binding protein
MTETLRAEQVGHAWNDAGREVQALHDVSFSVTRGEAVGIVGESGAGKSTLARILSGLIRPASGQVWLGDHRLAGPVRSIQLLFQEATASLDPLWSVQALVEEAGNGKVSAREWLERVGLDSALGGRRPHELSGGQAQRVALARSLAAEPAFLIADEPFSGLDVGLQRPLSRLLDSLRKEQARGLALITHELGLVRLLCSRALVLFAGRVVEEGPVETLFERPQHPYTAVLRRATEVGLSGTADPLRGPALDSGCPFHPRCPVKPQLSAEQKERCEGERPALRQSGGPEQRSACHFPERTPPV